MRTPSVKIERAENGYIVETANGRCKVYETLDKLLSYLLHYYEGRADVFTGDSYGCVIVHRKPLDKGTIPESEP